MAVQAATAKGCTVAGQQQLGGRGAGMVLIADAPPSTQENRPWIKYRGELLDPGHNEAKRPASSVIWLILVATFEVREGACAVGGVWIKRNRGKESGWCTWSI